MSTEMLLDLGFLPDDQQETAEDLGPPSKRFDAVITAADWTSSTIVDQIRRNNIELDPDFQRRQAWRQVRKSHFIESLILGVPVPQIVLAERKDKRGAFVVIDGKQRLLTLMQFCSPLNNFAFETFRLTGLEIRSDLNGRSFVDLQNDPRLASDLSALENSTIRTAVIRSWPDEFFLYTVFLRLNTGSVPLSPHELRRALHPGPFIRFIDEYCLESYPLRTTLRIDKPDFRMRDTELVLRYFAFRNFLDRYTGNMKPLLDETAYQLNLSMSNGSTLVVDQTEELDLALRTTTEIFGEGAFRKWNGERFERPLNRAVFDVMILHFAQPSCAKEATKVAARIVESFKALCADDEVFRASIEGTTKTIVAIYERLRRWGEVLREIVGPTVKLVELRDNRIIVPIR